MLRNITRLEQIIEGRIYHFCCDNDSPVNHCKEALARFLSHCVAVTNAQEAVQQSQPEVPAIPAIDSIPSETAS